MDIKSIFNKSVDAINKGAESIGQAIEDKKNSIDKYNYILSISNHLDGMIPYAIHNNNPSIGREEKILGLCLTITLEKANTINSLIPVDETIINIKEAVEDKTQIDYIFVITDKRLWILNKNEYKKYNFNEINKCEIVNKSLLSQGVNFNNNAFSFEGNEQFVSEFVKLLNDSFYREEIIKKETKRLCGIIPKLEITNKYGYGISIGINNEIVIHVNKENSSLININELEYMQLLLDNKVIMIRGKKDVTSQGSNLMPSKKMSIKFKLINNTYVVDIMPENTIASTVKVEDNQFQEAYQLAKDIFDTVEKIKFSI